MAQLRRAPNMRDLVAPAQQHLDGLRAIAHRRSSERRGLVVPPWETPEERAALDAFVADCPWGMTIEHIAPHGHPEIVGLHTIGNLAYLSRRENGAKGNDLPGGLSAAEAVERGMAIWRRDVDGDGTIHWERYSALSRGRR